MSSPAGAPRIGVVRARDDEATGRTATPRPEEPKQGADLAAQIAEFKSIMDREREEYEGRRREQERRLQFLMNMASTQIRPE